MFPLRVCATWRGRQSLVIVILTPPQLQQPACVPQTVGPSAVNVTVIPPVLIGTLGHPSLRQKIVRRGAQ